MKAEHFKDWFCATEGCKYSKEKQEGWDSAIHAIALLSSFSPPPPRTPPIGFPRDRGRYVLGSPG
jgi:hypothetical protein